MGSIPFCQFHFHIKFIKFNSKFFNSNSIFRTNLIFSRDDAFLISNAIVFHKMEAALFVSIDVVFVKSYRILLIKAIKVNIFGMNNPNSKFSYAQLIMGVKVK